MFRIYSSRQMQHHRGHGKSIAARGTSENWAKLLNTKMKSAWTFGMLTIATNSRAPIRPYSLRLVDQPMAYGHSNHLHVALWKFSTPARKQSTVACPRCCIRCDWAMRHAIQNYNASAVRKLIVHHRAQSIYSHVSVCHSSARIHISTMPIQRCWTKSMGFIRMPVTMKFLFISKL